ncbi:MAG: CPBP family intramembrane metalloprotease [Verrucomicrobiales bacterium]|nr:CPBP family intramembrane metalloprotease [Verrucomicrobiales bacterium]
MSPQRTNGSVLLVLYILAALVTGAILAPGLFKLGKWYAELAINSNLGDTPVLGALAEKCRHSDFPRYFNRAFLVAALVWLWPFSKWAGVTRTDLGLERNRFRGQDGAVGFILGSGVLLTVGFLFVVAGRFSGKSASLGSVLSTAVIAGIFVALLEEFFFRGALLGLLLRTLRRLPALLFLSFFFSIVHLLQPPVGLEVSDAEVHSGTGFWMVGTILGKFGDGRFLLSEFATLFLLGMILGWARLKTRSLWLSVGLHAGLVFALKLFAGITNRGKLTDAAGSVILDSKGKPKLVNPDHFLPWIGQDLKTGVAPLLALAALGLLTLGWLALRTKALAAAPPASKNGVTDASAEKS